MRKRVLIVPDKFKGTLTAAAAALAISRGWKSVRPDDELTLLPMSDGGDGFGPVLSRLLNGRERWLKTFDAARQPCEAMWWYDPQSKTAIIESAKVIGLAMLPPGKYHPFDLDTYGLGAVLRAAQKSGATRCVVGVGGSATNDGGFGLARSLGWRFLSKNGQELGAWTSLTKATGVEAPAGRKLFPKLVVATDVTNPLLGAQGCSRVYGPQKGLLPDDMAAAEASLEALAKVMKAVGPDLSKEPGAGAAGGLGYALMAFCGAERESGFEIFSRLAKLSGLIRDSDLVLTGEGSIDEQTAMGKGTGQVAALCAKLKRPCIGLAGVVDIPEKLGKNALFTATDSLVRLVAPEEAMARPAMHLAALAAEQARAVA
jgi:glycerate kinase